MNAALATTRAPLHEARSQRPHERFAKTAKTCSSNPA
jgi:hypothetical protein